MCLCGIVSVHAAVIEVVILFLGVLADCVCVPFYAQQQVFLSSFRYCGPICRVLFQQLRDQLIRLQKLTVVWLTIDALILFVC